MEFLALYGVKHYSKHKKVEMVIMSMICYAGIPLFLYLAISMGHGLATINTAWNVISTLYGILIGVVIFNEPVGSMQWFGALFSFTGLILIFLGSKPGKVADS